MAGTDPFRAACVIGWPVEHSRSPLIHRYWLERCGVPGDYRREAVRPEAFPAFVAELEARGYVGANVTIPHKEAALRLSESDELARTVGAANTLWLDRGLLRSTNTDVDGFLANLDTSAPRWDVELGTVLVLGAGGAARAVLFALLQRGAKRVLLANRTQAKAIALREQFGSAVSAIGWEDISTALRECTLLVNTTSLGMAGQPELALDPGPMRPSGAVVCDLVYVPLRTALLEQARARGLRTADGLGMLLHQAVRGFSLWFGVKPEVTPELRALVEADLVR